MGGNFSRQTRSVSTAILTYGKGKRRGMADRGPREIEDFVERGLRLRRISEINRPQGGSQAGDGEMQQNGAFGIAGGGTSGVSSDEDRPDGVQRL